MTTRYFTLQEANHLLPALRPLVAELLERQARAAQQYQSVAPILDQAVLNVGTPVASELLNDFAAIDALLAKINRFGCVVCNVRVGLIEFLAEVDGREVNLSWRFGEESVNHYYDLGQGFNDRRKIKS